MTLSPRSLHDEASQWNICLASSLIQSDVYSNQCNLWMIAVVLSHCSILVVGTLQWYGSLSHPSIILVLPAYGLKVRRDIHRYMDLSTSESQRNRQPEQNNKRKMIDINKMSLVREKHRTNQFQCWALPKIWNLFLLIFENFLHIYNVFLLHSSLTTLTNASHIHPPLFSQHYVLFLF